jgi:tetratricopeptide (TPR) repeat protein
MSEPSKDVQKTNQSTKIPPDPIEPLGQPQETIQTSHELGEQSAKPSPEYQHPVGLQVHASYATVWQFLIAIVGTALVAIPATYLALRESLDTAIYQRIQPYEHLLYGSQLEGNLQFDEAITEFDLGFSSAVERGEGAGKSARLGAYLASYLRALADCEQPTRYRSQFERCRGLFARHLVTETSEHQRCEGWYLLRVGELAAATELFEKALRQAKINDSI